MQYVTAQKLETRSPYESDPPKPGRLRVQSYLLDDDFESDGERSNHPTSLYSNLTVLSVARSSRQEKGAWTIPTEEASSTLDSSGTFSRLMRSAGRKPEKLSHDRPHAVTLNLHQFQMANGESLGEDPDHWARLTF